MRYRVQRRGGRVWEAEKEIQTGSSVGREVTLIDFFFFFGYIT